MEKSFFNALTEVHVEKLKKQIEREWGTTIDKAVDLTIKTVAKQWQASLSNLLQTKSSIVNWKKYLKLLKNK